MQQNSIGFIPQTGFINWGLFLSNAQSNFVESFSQITTPSNQFDIYTVPAGYKAIINGFNFTNASVATTWVFKICLKQGGVYYSLQNGNSTIAANATATQAPVYIFNPGDVIAVDGNQTGLLVNVAYQITLIPTAFCGKTVNFTTFGGSGVQNTIYTLPAATQTVFTSAVGGLGANGAPFIWNSTGGTRTYQAYLVPPAGSPGANNQIAKNGTINNNILSSGVGLIGSLSTAGTTIQIESDSATTASATQWGWLTMFELPA